MPPERLIPWLALHLLPGVGPLSARRALEMHGDPAHLAFHVPAAAWREVPGVDAATALGIAAARPSLERRVEQEWREAVRRSVHILSREDPGYPAMIAAQPDAPLVLYVKGELAEGAVRLAIVGSRRASAYGRAAARALAGELAERGAEIVSGGARGIDTSAHEGALAARGRTVAVLGCGCGRTYPPENEDLFERIASGGGALVSEFPMGMPPLPENFPRRNRLISALSAATIVVEATAKSGSLITAAHALEQGREVMAVPGPFDSETSVGCHRLIQQGAKLVAGADDVLEELSPMYREALSGSRGTGAGTGANDTGEGDGATPDEVATLALLDDPRPVHVDVLADRAPFGIARLQSALFALVLRGSLDQLPGGYYVARPRKGPFGS